jgi:hypothetical protein
MSAHEGHGSAYSALMNRFHITVVRLVVGVNLFRNLNFRKYEKWLVRKLETARGYNRERLFEMLKKKKALN